MLVRYWREQFPDSFEHGEFILPASGEPTRDELSMEKV